MREGGRGAALDQRGQPFALRRVAARRDRAAGHQRAEERLDHQAAPEALEHHGEVEPRAAETAVGFLEQRADHAQLGEAAPQVGVVTRL